MTWLARLRIPVEDQRGSGLVESIVVVAISATAIIAFVVALSTGSIAIGVRDQQATAQSLAQSQLEFIMGQPHSAAYPQVPITLPEGYAISVGVGPIHRGGTDIADIQRITVTISRGGEEILTVETYRMNR